MKEKILPGHILTNKFRLKVEGVADLEPTSVGSLKDETTKVELPDSTAASGALHCRMIVISIVSVFAASAGWWKGRALLAYYAFAVAMLFASGLVAILATCSIPINPVRGMALIVVASFSQAALAVVTAMSQAATLTLASVLAKHAEEVDIDL